MDDIVLEFIAESVEGLQAVDNELIELENSPVKSSLINDIFRVIHSIKGTCGFFGFVKLAELAHLSEDIISKIRSEQFKINRDVISVILESVDAVRSIILYIQKHGVEPSDDYSAVIQKIKANILLAQKNQDMSAENEKSSISYISSTDNKNSLDYEVSKTIRVNVDALEKLMQTVTELVLSRNQLLQISKDARDGRLLSSVSNLNSITTLLQEEVMEARMQPISYAWSLLPKLLRDVSNVLNKKVKLVTSGGSTKLDKQLIEVIRDPVVQMVRNSVAHGIEDPLERLAIGKPEIGVISLSACHDNGSVVIELSDDGRGLSLAKIRAKVLEKNIASEDKLLSMSDEEIIQYIFYPGFSMSQEVTSVSGRGVGMSLVKSNIEDINGSINIRSEEGKGITFIITIPLTLAIDSALIIEAGNQKFAIPERDVVEIVRVSDELGHMLEEVQGKKFLHLRGELVPSVKLSSILGIKDGLAEFIVICKVKARRYGLIVNAVYNIEEIVLKHLPSIIKSIDMYIGNALLGDDEIVMILDPSSLMRNCESIPLESDALENKGLLLKQALPKLLLFEVNDVYKALLSEFVVRIVEMDMSYVQFLQDKQIIQHEDFIAKILLVEKDYKFPLSYRQLVVIIRVKDELFAMLVNKVIGLVDDYTAVDSGSSVVIKEKKVELIDLNNGRYIQ